ncbi:acyl-CoA dehydrogenase family protein [Haloglomus salinum]|uniref:acyl-CoA dehydrogenase family protein n=1 Tax=Haloglomus salinum TaxID=2962673 RepID=UPI0020C996E4|nr:acyl-CoA dehydrogenase family protein [Haloglomus salinum]
MDVSYDDSERGREVAARTREFVDEVVLPEERALLGQRDERSAADRQEEAESLIDDLREAAREHDVYGPQIPEAYGGLGMEFDDLLPVFEEAGRSILAMRAMHVAAPDEGNIHILDEAGTEAQKEEYLRPLANAEITSGFSMTEPLDGSGSDPKSIRTTAEKDGDEWVIDGHKWWTTQGSDADFLIVVARTNQDAHPYMGVSLFIVDADADGVELVRDVPHMGEAGMAHSEIKYDGVRVPEENLLGTKDAGFAIAQQRLGPARLTHCMRFVGMADRSLDIATAYMHEREAFGEPLAEKQALRFDIAEAETRLHAVRTMVRHAARQIAAGEQARTEVAMTKTFAAGVVQDVIDDCVQVCGGNGIGKDLPLADFYENVRCFRIIDGADEVHKRSIARRALDPDDVVSEEVEHITRYEG